MNTQALVNFRHLGLLTLLFVYLVIIAGGIVRASGAGMGCPDWPTCFGQLIPPTDSSQLSPEWLFKLKTNHLQFNALKTWTEYTNRLLGVTLGILILLTASVSHRFLKTDKTVFYLSLSSVLLVGFQGWMGSVVVASNLQPFKITLHMLLALLLVALLIYTLARSQRQFIEKLDSSALAPKVKTVLSIAIVMTLLQVAMGVQVREMVDFITHQASTTDRHLWREAFPVIFYLHRSFSSIILVTNLWIVWKIFSVVKERLLWRLALSLAIFIVTAIIAGVCLDRLGMPAVVQPIHLLMANLIFGTQLCLWLCLKSSSIS